MRELRATIANAREERVPSLAYYILWFVGGCYHNLLW